MKNLSESKIRIKILKNSLTLFEKSEAYTRHKAWLAMPSTEQQKLWTEWNLYYKKVKESRLGRLMLKQKEAFAKKEMDKVIEIAKWTNENFTSLRDECGDRPLFPDPYETIHNVGTYLSKKSEYENLKRSLAISIDDDDNLI